MMKTKNEIQSYSNMSQIPLDQPVPEGAIVDATNGNTILSRVRNFIKSRPLLNRILKKTPSVFSAMGMLGSAAVLLTSICTICGAAFCPPLILGIIGIASSAISILGLICKTIKQFVDDGNKNYKALGTQILGKVEYLVILAVASFVPVTGVVPLIIKGLATLTGFVGLGIELIKNYKKDQLISEYGEFIGGIIKKVFDFQYREWAQKIWRKISEFFQKDPALYNLSSLA